MGKFLFFLNSAYVGLGIFFSFYVAPTLFRVLEKDQAGKVVERVFPVYFGIGLFFMLLSTIFGLNFGKLFFLLALLNLSIHGLHVFYVLPKAGELKLVDYSAFMKLHGISMALNLVGLFITLIMLILLARRM